MISFDSGLIRKFTFLFILLFSCIQLCARTYSPEEMKMPNLMAGEYISDPESLLSTPARNSVNRKLEEVRTQTTAEVGVAIVPDLGDMEVEDFANRLYDLWKVGKKDKSNGVLLIISPGSRQARIQTGYGTEGVIPDAVASQIMRNQIIPAMKIGDLDSAVIDSTSEIAKILTDPEYAEELRSDQEGFGTFEGMSPQEKAALKTSLSWLAVIIFLAGGITLLYIWRLKRSLTRRDKVTSYKNLLWILIVMGVLSFGAGLVWALICWSMLRKARNTSDPCPNCGYPHMKRLSGLEESQHLTPPQQTERQLGSVKFDVWRCPRCGDSKVDAYDNPFSSYTVCDKCGTKAMHAIGSRTVQHPTVFRNGVGEYVYKCEYCDHERHQRYVIPHRARTAAVGAAALGAGRRMGGGSSSSGFGGFGGGFSGGGGASGRW